MNPNENQNGQLPPRGQTPQYGINSVPQQAPNGQYEVLPTPAVTGRPTGHNPYEFIVNPNTPAKSRFSFGGSGFGKKIAVIVGGGVLLMIVIAVIGSLIFSKKDLTPQLTSLAQQQQEIIRVAIMGTSQATAQSTRNFAVTTQAAMLTSQQQIVGYLGTTGTTLSTKDLSVTKSAETDKTLAAALATSTFDTAVRQNLTTQLSLYEDKLESALAATSNAKLKTILTTNKAAAQLLLSDTNE